MSLRTCCAFFSSTIKFREEDVGVDDSACIVSSEVSPGMVKQIASDLLREGERGVAADLCFACRHRSVCVRGDGNMSDVCFMPSANWEKLLLDRFAEQQEEVQNAA